MKKIIDKELLKALRNLVDSLGGGQSELGRMSGVSQKQISNYLSGKSLTMTQSSWKRLYPFLRHALPDAYGEYINMPPAGTDLIPRKMLLEKIIACNSLDNEAKLAVIQLINNL